MKKLVALIGGILFLISISLWHNLQTGESRAISLNKEKTIFAAVSEDTPPFCNWDVKLNEPVISEDKSKAIVVRATNSSGKECQTIISMRAPGFDLTPSKEEQSLTLPSNGKGSVSWIVTPRKTGTYEIALSDYIDTKIFGITVTNTFGLSSFQAKTFSLLGSLFGPMLTIPWWFDRLRQRKPKQQEVPKEEKAE